MRSKCALDGGCVDCKESQTLADGEAENSILGTALGWGSCTLVFSAPRFPCLHTASVPVNNRHVLPIRQLSDSSCLLLFWDKALGVLGTDTGSSRLPLSFDMPTYSHDVQTRWDQPAGTGDPLLLQLPLLHRGKQSLMGNACRLCSEAQGHAVSPTPVRWLQAGSCPGQVLRKKTHYLQKVTRAEQRGQLSAHHTGLHMDEMKGQFPLTVREQFLGK